MNRTWLSRFACLCAFGLLVLGAVNCKTPTVGSGLLDDEDAVPPGGDVVVVPEQLRVQMARQGLVGVVGSEFHSQRNNTCVNCHADMDGAKLHEWAGKMHAFIDTCALKNMYNDVFDEERARRSAECIKDNIRTSGLFRTGAKTSVVGELFRVAGMESNLRPTTRASMPPGNTEGGLDDEEFANLFAWVNLYQTWDETALNDIRAILINEGGSPPPAPLATCEEGVSEEMKTHIQGMTRGGWTARNTANPNMQMFGCKEGVDDPKLCFSQQFFRGPGGVARFPQRNEFVATRSATGIVRGAKVRLLKNIGQDYTSYWSRASADGRFIAVGGRGFERLDALLTEGEVGQLPINASYDPGFFPNNSGFVFQGGGLLVCNMKVLDDPEILARGNIQVGGGFDFEEEEEGGGDIVPADGGEQPLTPEEKYCSVSGDVSLYQSVGTSLTGEDYFYLAGGNWVGDDGSSYGDLPVSAFAHENSSMQLHLSHSKGPEGSWADNNQFNLTTPFQGDWFLSPSGMLMIGREATRPANPGDESVHNGYVISKLAVTYEGEGAEKRIANVQTQEVAKICLNGRKPTMSFDERFLATHHYVKKHDYKEYGFENADDPAFVELVDNSADIWLVDLATGKKARVTNVGAGRKALYPHFRSDGWMYFLVKDYASDGTDEYSASSYYMASDAAVIMARD